MAYDFDGNVRILAVDKDGNETVIAQFHNALMDVGKTLLCGALTNQATSPRILYMAWGNSNTAVATSQIKLGAEANRKAIANYTPNGTGSFITRCYLSPTDGLENSGDIKELAWFAASASIADPDGKDEGTMMSRVLWAHTKTGAESLIIERTDTIP